jgi:hypothetical protein
MDANTQEIEALERTAAWRLRLVDADPSDTASTVAASALGALAENLRRNDYAALWTELDSIGNWMGESDAISDYADLVADYRTRIGIAEHPQDGEAYLHALLAIARKLL